MWSEPPAVLPFLGGSGATWALVERLQPQRQEGVSPASHGRGRRGGSWLRGERPSSCLRFPRARGGNREGRERPTLLPTCVPQGGAGRADKLQNSLELRKTGPRRG